MSAGKLVFCHNIGFLSYLINGSAMVLPSFFLFNNGWWWENFVFGASEVVDCKMILGEYHMSTVLKVKCFNCI